MSQKDSNSRLDDKKRKSFKKSEIKTKRVDLPLLRRTLKQPASIPEGFFPDPFELFLEEEENELRDFLDRCLNPRNLNLTSDEVIDDAVSDVIFIIGAFIFLHYRSTYGNIIF